MCGLGWVHGNNIMGWVSGFIEQEAPLTLRGQRGRCRNIAGEQQIYGSFPNPRPRSLFFWVWFSWRALANPGCMPNLKLLALAVAQILKGIPQISESSLSPRPQPLLPPGVIL